MSSAPAEHAGIASAVNNDVARFGGLLAVAVLAGELAGITGMSYLHPDALGVRASRRPALICAVLCWIGSALVAGDRHPQRSVAPGRSAARAGSGARAVDRGVQHLDRVDRRHPLPSARSHSCIMQPGLAVTSRSASVARERWRPSIAQLGRRSGLSRL